MSRSLVIASNIHAFDIIIYIYIYIYNYVKSMNIGSNN